MQPREQAVAYNHLCSANTWHQQWRPGRSPLRKIMQVGFAGDR